MPALRFMLLPALQLSEKSALPIVPSQRISFHPQLQRQVHLHPRVTPRIIQLPLCWLSRRGIRRPAEGKCWRVLDLQRTLGDSAGRLVEQSSAPRDYEIPVIMMNPCIVIYHIICNSRKVRTSFNCITIDNNHCLLAVGATPSLKKNLKKRKNIGGHLRQKYP